MRAVRLVNLVRLCCTVLAVLLPLRAAPAQTLLSGRVASATGPVLLRAPARADWVAVPRGGSVEIGHAVRTGQRSQAELEFGANRVGLDPNTILRLDAPGRGGFTVALEQGRAMLLLRSLQPGQSATLLTPRATVTFGQPGLYVVDIGLPGDARPSTIGVTRGQAQIHGAGVSLLVRAGQTGVVGAGVPGELRGGVAEGFLVDDPTVPLPTIVRPSPVPVPPAAAAPPAAAPPTVAPPVVAQLRDDGWDQRQEYGAVWYPPLAPGWSPYRDGYGRYADDTPWDYAPYRRGPWTQVGPRSGWLPPHAHDRIGRDRVYDGPHVRPYDAAPGRGAGGRDYRPAAPAARPCGGPRVPC